MVVLFGIFCAIVYTPGKTSAGIPLCRKVAWVTAALLIVFHSFIEWGEGYYTYVKTTPRGYIQWEHVIADWLGVLIGLAVVYGFIRSKGNVLRTVVPTEPSIPKA